MTRALTLLRLFIKTSLLAELEYRVNFVGLLLMSAMDAAWSIGGALLFYSHRASIGGWSFHEALVVNGLYFLAYGFVDVVVRPNIDELVQHIRTGTLDFVLTKPLNSQAHATLRRYSLNKLSSVVGGLAIIIYALVQLRQSPCVAQLALFALLAVGAGVLLYSTMVILGTLSFWLVDIGGIDEAVVGFLEAGRYPRAACPETLRGLLTFVVPIAFITTVPAEVLLGRLAPEFVLYGWIMAAALLVAAVVFWKVALRHYSSASS